MNKQAFLWGRRKAAEPAAVEAIVAPLRRPAPARSQARSLAELIDRRADFLAAYQDAAYAAHYRRLVARVVETERIRTPGQEALTEAVARYLLKLMAIKDEYEVARLYADGAFARQLEATFDGDLKLEFHLAPPILGRKNAKGEALKTSFGPWVMQAFRLLARLKRLRGTPFDVFGYSRERRIERRILADYEALIEELLASLSPEITPAPWRWRRSPKKSAASAM